MNDKYYQKILNKFKEGIYTQGKACYLRRKSLKVDINNIPIEKRTPELCADLINYGRCRFSDVPKSSRTREFFITTFTDDEVYEYIKNNIQDFDRQFFKDLITSNGPSIQLKNNCFAIMPLEYIDEELCSLAILGGYNCESWFYSLIDRKPNVLTEEHWKLAARLYNRTTHQHKHFLEMTPVEYKDEEYYKQMCRCTSSDSYYINRPDERKMDPIPKEILTSTFLRELLLENIDYVNCFSESALETIITYQIDKDSKTITDKVWKIAIMLKGETIRSMKLNDERIEYFLSLYDKDSIEYKYYFKDRYKQYLKTKKNQEAVTSTSKNNQTNIEDSFNRVILSAFAYSLNGDNPTKSIDDEINRNKTVNSSLLPIKYRGVIPQEYRKAYDKEEYLELLYNILGIELVEEHDRLFYRVILPKDWTTVNNCYQNYVKDEFGNTIIEYFYDPLFYDREAYVKKVNISIEEINQFLQKRDSKLVRKLIPEKPTK